MINFKLIPIDWFLYVEEKESKWVPELLHAEFHDIRPEDLPPLRDPKPEPNKRVIIIDI